MHGAARAAAVDDRLVVAGDQAAVAALGGHETVDLEVRLEELARGGLVSGRDCSAELANARQRLGARAAGEKSAQARLEGGARPAGQRCEACRLVARSLGRGLRRRADWARRTGDGFG